MKNINSGKVCIYTNICSVYNGESDINGTPLHVHRNVFCNRGNRGWNNCRLYTKFKTQNSEELI